MHWQAVAKWGAPVARCEPGGPMLYAQTRMRVQAYNIAVRVVGGGTSRVS